MKVLVICVHFSLTYREPQSSHNVDDSNAQVKIIQVFLQDS